MTSGQGEVRDGRPIPITCFQCKTDNIVAHCSSPQCTWIRCKKCQAVSGYKHAKHGSGVFAGWKQVFYPRPT